MQKRLRREKKNETVSSLLTDVPVIHSNEEQPIFSIFCLQIGRPADDWRRRL